ncbi:helix-turn-helix transcriptional regulator [Streptomyces sp. RFCAC02]|uniref:helix-turn-helix transcriptional regulator n=1 Tax=Streptomyces sp. RFCAC02 TaxID=2499143 RepID=UPI00101F2A6F|nr:helix-turn-helix transcriptional regulator [Streptomyces sp. RFCAC02]
MDDATIGEFLRSRRARVRPEDAGLPQYGRRRVPGLRREEVAQLAGVSVDYYVRLEQGRGTNVSDAVLDAVARVLRLDRAEREYLYALVRPGRGRGGVPGAGEAAEVRAGTRLLLDSLTATPAFVLDRSMDVLAWNALGDAVMGFGRMGPGRPSMPRFCFLDPAARELFPEWRVVAEECVAFLRLAAGRAPGAGGPAGLVRELSVLSEDFRALWGEQRVVDKAFGVKRVRHPEAGVLEFRYETLRAPSDDGRFLVLYTAEPGTPTVRWVGERAARTV